MLWKIEIFVCSILLMVLTSAGAQAQRNPKIVCAENIASAEKMVADTETFKAQVADFAMGIATEGFGDRQLSSIGEIRRLRHSVLAALEEYRQKAEDVAYAMRTCAR